MLHGGDSPDIPGSMAGGGAFRTLRSRVDRYKDREPHWDNRLTPRCEFVSEPGIGRTAWVKFVVCCDLPHGLGGSFCSPRSRALLGGRTRSQQLCFGTPR